MTEPEDDWWNKDKPEKPKPSEEELIEKIERMKVIERNLPKGLLFKQFAAIVYVIINAIFMYANIRSNYIGYVAVYMIPLTVMILDYILVVGSLKKIARGE